MKRTLAIITAGAILAAPALSIGSVHARPQHAGITLTVWEDNSTPTEAGLTALAKKYTASTGNAVNFVHFAQPGQGSNSISNVFPLKARSTSGPDVIYVPEDEAGKFFAGSLVAPRPASVLSSSDQALFQPAALGATVLKGTPYSVPDGVDGLLLYYNKKLISTPPTSFAQLISKAKALTKGGQYGFLYNITGGLYWNFWAFGAYGVHLFNLKNGQYNPNDIGVNSAEAQNALGFIGTLTSIVPKSADYNAPDSNFSAGKAAMIINGPWGFQAYIKALGADNVGVAPIPALPGNAIAHPFVGVRVYMVSAFSKNQAAAWDLAKYLSLNDEAITGAEGRLPALKSVPGYTLSPQQDAAAKALSVGIPIPNIPEMDQVWGPMGNAITLVIQGRTTPKVALVTALLQIRAGIAKLNQ